MSAAVTQLHGMLPILVSEPSHGSGTGVSYYSTRCARQARLDKEAPRESSFDAQVGTCFHKLMELYYTKTLDKYLLPFDDTVACDQDPMQEALRIFTKYTELYPAEEMTYLACEKLLPETPEQGVAIARAVGLEGHPFTCRLDAVVELDEAQAAMFTTRCGKEIVPGRYLEDHKVKKQKDSNAYLKWSRSAQFTAYFLAWNTAFPDLAVRGTIVNSPIRHKNLTAESFQRFVFDAPSQSQIEAVRAHLRRKAEYLQGDTCNLDACDDWSGCSHYVTGRCNRV